MEKAKKFPLAKLIIVAAVLLVVIAATITVVFWKEAITMYFEGAGASYETANAIDAHAHGVEICDEIEQEGIVLLENRDNALPLPSGAKVTVFGYDATDFYYGGAGSGAGGGEKNPTTFTQALQHAGFSVNEEILSMYATTGIKRGVISMGGSDFSIGEIPRSYYTDALLNNAKANYGDAAIVVIGRSGAEGGDVARDMSEYEAGNTGHYLELNKDELDMLALANENFETVILVINAPSAIELGWLKDGTYEHLKAAIWVGQPGPYGMDAIGKVLNGTVNPSGHLVDTYARDFTQDPTYANFGHFEYTDAPGYYFVNYNEGIYVGYRYYETRYEDVVLGDKPNTGDYSYADAVVYPFGYGLSYTSFEWSNFTMTDKGDSYEFSVQVKNTGSAAGKDVVQIYVQKPYTGAIEKSAIDLVGFVKTSLLDAGASETVTVTVAKEQMASYDYKDAKTYVLEAGEYYFTAAINAHEAVNNVLAQKGFTIANGMTAEGNTAMVASVSVAATDATTYAKDSVTGTEITNQFDNAERGLVYLSRNDWAGTFPTAETVVYTAGDRAANFEYVVTDEGLTKETVQWEQTNGLKLQDMQGKDYDDPDWDKLIFQMSKSEMKGLIGGAGWKTNKYESIGKPKTLDLDGPAGFSEFYNVDSLGGVQYPVEVVIASTWNTEIAEKMGDAIAAEATAYGITGWYGPAMNIHRSPFAGRNFEYYSEDGFIGGKMGAATVEAAWKHGVYAYIKHFALNDQETNRSAKGVMTWSNEQAIREIYLKPFELSVKEGGAIAVMSSFNRIGDIWSGGHRGLLTNVLRNEWGFKGFVLTDAVQSTHMITSQGLRAGNDAWLSVSVVSTTTNDEHSDYTWTCIKNAAHRMLYVIANSNIWEIEAQNAPSGTPLWMILYGIGAGVLVLADLAFGAWTLLQYSKKKKAAAK